MTETPPPDTSSQSHLPLLGKRILVTRTRDQAAEFIKLLEQLGAAVHLFPTIQIAPPHSWEACDRGIGKIETYDGVIFTSVNAVEKFFSRLNTLRPESTAGLAGKKIYAVGEKTRSAAEKYNLTVSASPGVTDSKQLAIFLSRSDVTGKQYFFPKGNLAGDVVTFALREHGAIVDEAIVYETIQPSGADAKVIEDELMNKQIDVVTFFSPSSVSNFLAIIPLEALRGTVVAAIGHTTASAAKNLSLPVHIVAEHATSANLAASIVRHYE